MGNQINIVMTGDESRAFKAMQALIDQQVKFKSSIDNTAKASKSAGQDLESSFGSAAMTDLVAYAGGMVSVAGAVGIVTEALQRMKKAREDASNRLLTTEGSAAALGELAGGDAQKINRLVKQAEEIYRKGGAPDEPSANRLVYQLESSDVPQEWRDKAHMLYPMLDRPDALISGITTIRRAMGPEEAGSFDQLLAKGVAAGKKTNQSATQMLESTASVAASGKQRGLRDEELLAAVTMLSQVTGSASEGATQLDAFLRSVTEGKLGQFKKGTSIADLVESIDKHGFSEFDLQEKMGRKEALAGYVALRDRLGDYREQLTDIDAANSEQDMLTKLYDSTQNIPKIRAPRMMREARADLELSTIPMGTKHALYEAAKAKELLRTRQAGAYEWQIDLKEWGMDKFTTLTGEWGERNFVREILGDKAAAEYDRIGVAAATGQTIEPSGETTRSPISGTNPFGDNSNASAISKELIEELRANTAATAENNRLMKAGPRTTSGGVLLEPTVD